MKLGILKTDALKPEFVKQFGEYPDMFARRIHAIDTSIELVTYDVQKGFYPKDLNEVDAYLITGSKSSVYDQEPWLDELKDFVRVLHKAKKKLIGICFGHQLVAEVLGGKTGKADQGWCVGVHEAVFSEKAQDHLGHLKNDQKSFSLVSSHQDQVLQIAKGSEVIASTQTCPNYMTVLGDHIITVQGHPEFDTEFASQLLDMRRSIFGEELYSTAKRSLKESADNLLVIRWCLDFIR